MPWEDQEVYTREDGERESNEENRQGLTLTFLHQ